MDKIASFTIDHERLLRGIYVSRQDKTPSGDSLTTFDIRLTEPNRMPPVKPETLHTIEHLAATYLRNHPRWKERVVYWGPMGCCTGCYLILQGNLSSQDILPLIDETFRFISGFEGEIPGASSKDCGNWRFNDLEDAKLVAAKFLEEVITNITPSKLNYPKPL